MLSRFADLELPTAFQTIAKMTKKREKREINARESFCPRKYS